MKRVRLTLLHNQPIGTIAPELHGHFVEMLSGCVNGGIWNTKKNDYDELILRKSADLGLELIRWPGGCFADAYNWRDGVGPVKDRPTTITNRWGPDEVENHRFGSHEFMEFCRRTGAKAWINGNVATGSPREMVEWIEYLSYRGDTTLSRQRAAHGHPEAYDVAYWGVGNECWDCGGKFTPTTYGEAYRRFESAIPRYKDMPMRLIVGGPDGNKPEEREVWTEGVLKTLFEWRRPRIYAVDAHFYIWGDPNGTGKSNAFNADQFSALMWRTLEIEDMFLKQREIIDRFDRGIKLMIGEYGPWHSDAWEKFFWQHVTLRDAVCVAAHLDLFHNHCDILAAATYTQLCNILGAPFQTVDGVSYSTPVYEVFSLYKAHRGQEAIRYEVETEEIRFPFRDQTLSHQRVTASVSRAKDGRYVLTCANLDPNETAELVIGGDEITFGSARAWLLHADDPQTSHQPGRDPAIAPKSLAAKVTNGQVVIELPAAGIVKVELAR